MQKIVNAIAIASGAVSLAVVGLGGYVFIRKDAIIDNIKSKVMESVMQGGLGDIGGGALGGSLKIPSLGAPAPDRAPTQDAPTAPSFPTSPF